MLLVMNNTSRRSDSPVSSATKTRKPPGPPLSPRSAPKARRGSQTAAAVSTRGDFQAALKVREDHESDLTESAGGITTETLTEPSARLVLSRPTAAGSLVAKSPDAPPARLKGESEQAYARFCTWLQPGEGLRRSFARAANEHGVDASTVREQASRYEWIQRAVDYDRRMVAVKASQGLELAAESSASAYSLCERLMGDLAAIQAELEDETLEIEVRTKLALDVSKVVERLVKTQRLLAGLSTSNSLIKVTKAPDAAAEERAELFSCMTARERELFFAIKQNVHERREWPAEQLEAWKREQEAVRQRGPMALLPAEAA